MGLFPSKPFLASHAFSSFHLPPSSAILFFSPYQQHTNSPSSFSQHFPINASIANPYKSSSLSSSTMQLAIFHFCSTHAQSKLTHNCRLPSALHKSHRLCTLTCHLYIGNTRRHSFFFLNITINSPSTIPRSLHFTMPDFPCMQDESSTLFFSFPSSPFNLTYFFP
jgi:hypothetical protein